MKAKPSSRTRLLTFLATGALLWGTLGCSSELGAPGDFEGGVTTGGASWGGEPGVAEGSGGATGGTEASASGATTAGMSGGSEAVGTGGAEAPGAGGDTQGTGGSDANTGGGGSIEPDVPVSSGTPDVDELDASAQFFNNSKREFSYSSNSAPHQQNAVLVADGYLFVVYFDADGSLVLARRPENNDNAPWVKRAFSASHDQTDPDSHRTANIAVSPNDKRLHIMWGHHADKLRYVVTKDANATTKSNAQFQTSLFEAERQYLKAGENLTKVCYPRLFVGADDKLQVVWRDDGGSGSGNSYIATYNDNKTWSSRLKIIDGKVGTYDGDGNRNAYFNDIGYRDGVTHVSWTWRENAKSQNGYVTNHDLHYAYSENGGNTWKNRLDETVGNSSSMTMNLNSKDIKFKTLDYTKRVENQCGQAIDRSGRVHMLWRHNNGSDDKTLYHYFKSAGSSEVHTRERSELPGSIRSKIYADPTDHGDETLYIVTVAGSKVTVYGANKGEDYWGSWSTLYKSTANYITATAQIADDGRKLFILAQKRPTDLEKANSSGLDVIVLPVAP